MAAQAVAAAGGNWSASATWSPGSVPVAGDDVVLNSSSGNLTIDVSTNAVRSFVEQTSFTGTVTLNSSITLNLGGASAGNFTLVGTATWVNGSATTSTVQFAHTVAGCQLTTSSAILPMVTFNGVGGEWTVQDTLNNTATSTLTLIAGTLNTNGQTCSWGLFQGAGSLARTLTLGASAITLTGTNFSSSPWQVVTSTNFTCTTNTAVLTFTGTNNANAVWYVGNAPIWNGLSLVFTGAGPCVCNLGGQILANITRVGTAATDAFTLNNGSVTVTGTLTLMGNSSTKLLVKTNIPGATYTVTAGAVSMEYVDFQDITGAGAAAPWTGTSLGDCGGNSGITFTSPLALYAVNAGAANFSTGGWSLSSGGTTGQRVPLPQDSVIFDANSGTGTVTFDMPRFSTGLSFTGFIGTAAFSSTANSVFGSVTLGSAMTISGTQTLTLAGRSSGNTFTSSGKTLTQALTLNGPTGTYTIQDSLLTAGALTVTGGTLATTSSTVTCLTFALNNANGAISMGSGTWNLTQTTATTVWNVTAGTVTAGTSTIAIATASTNTRTFAGGGKSYNNLTYNLAASPGALAITGANTFNTLTIGSGRQLIMPASTANTFTSFNVNGQNNGYLYLPGVSGNYVSTPNASANQITGNLTFDVYAALNNWASGNQMFVSKEPSSGEYAYDFWVNSGLVNLRVSTNGTTFTTFTSSASTGFAAGSINWLRGSLTLNNGSNSTCQFFTSPDGLNWTQLGTTLTGSIISSIFNSTGALELGSSAGGTSSLMIGALYEVRMYNSALGFSSGTPVFDANFTTKPFGANSFTESSSNAATVTINGTLAQCGDGRIMVNSSTGGTQATLSKTSGTVSCSYLSIQDSKAQGGASWYAGGTSVNVSNNTGWIFSSAYAPDGFFGLFD